MKKALLGIQNKIKPERVPAPELLGFLAWTGEGVLLMLAEFLYQITHQIRSRPSWDSGATILDSTITTPPLTSRDGSANLVESLLTSQTGLGPWELRAMCPSVSAVLCCNVSLIPGEAEASTRALHSSRHCVRSSLLGVTLSVPSVVCPYWPWDAFFCSLVCFLLAVFLQSLVLALPLQNSSRTRTSKV